MSRFMISFTLKPLSMLVGASASSNLFTETQVQLVSCVDPQETRWLHLAIVPTVPLHGLAFFSLCFYSIFHKMKLEWWILFFHQPNRPCWNWLRKLPNFKSYLRMVYVKHEILSHHLYKQRWDISTVKVILLLNIFALIQKVAWWPLGDFLLIFDTRNCLGVGKQFFILFTCEKLPSDHAKNHQAIFCFS